MAKTNNTAADVKNAAAKNTNTNKTNTAAAKNAAPVKEYAKLSAVDVVALSAEWIKKYGTISAIRAEYAALCEEYGKDNVKDVLKNAQTIRAEEIKRAAESMNADVFTFGGISAAVFAAVARTDGYAALCKFARRAYTGTDGQIAAAVIADYYTAVDESGAPLCKVSHVSADGLQICTTYERRALTHTNAVTILKSALDGMAAAATNAATRANGNDNAAAVRNNKKTAAVVVAVYAAATDENGRVSFGERRDTSADAKTKERAAALLGKSLPVGYVPVSVWNAAVNGKEDAIAAVEDAKNAAKNAAAAAGHAAAVNE